MKCSTCGKSEDLPFKCKFCNQSFCSTHRLPENHECYGLEKHSKNKEWIYNPLKRKSGPKNAKRIQSRSFLNYLPRKGVNLLLLIIVVISIIGFMSRSFMNKFAILPLDTLTRPWILLTSIFLHAGFLHLFFNGYALFLFGHELERRIGKRKIIELFLVTGIVGSLGYVLFSILTGTNNLALGASGAVYGIFGALTVLAPEIRLLILFVPKPITLRFAIGLFIILDFLWISAGVPIANSAHISGLLAGIIYGLILKKSYKQRHQKVREFFEI